MVQSPNALELICADFNPALELLRPIPPIAWIPAAILFFPQVELGVIFICFLGAFFPIVLNTMVGVTQIDQTYFRAAGCLGEAEFNLLRGAGEARLLVEHQA